MAHVSASGGVGNAILNAGATTVDDIDEMAIFYTLFKSPFLYIYIVYYLAVLIPSIAVTVRRLHDIGKSGHWAFFVCSGSVLGFIGNIFSDSNPAGSVIFDLLCMVVAIICLVWMFTNSEYGPNKYGPNPKGEGNTEVPAEN